MEPNRAYDLPMAELDRFMTKLHLGYPNEAAETEMLGDVVGHHPISSRRSPWKSHSTTGQSTCPFRSYSLIRDSAGGFSGLTPLGVSPRGSISLLRAAQARAVLDGRNYVFPRPRQLSMSALTVSALARSEQDVAGTRRGRTRYRLVE